MSPGGNYNSDISLSGSNAQVGDRHSFLSDNKVHLGGTHKHYLYSKECLCRKCGGKGTREDDKEVKDPNEECCYCGRCGREIKKPDPEEV